MPTILSIGVVLFVSGLFLFIWKSSSMINTYFRENFELRVFLHHDVSEEDGVRFSLTLKQTPGVHSVKFISKDEAAIQELDIQGKDFIDKIGYNPLPHAIHATLKEDFIQDSIVKKLTSQILSNPFVEDIRYPDDILRQFNQNIQTIHLTLIGIITLFILASILVINNTIRLNIFARRFLIKSMQYVGAKDTFIIKPFIKSYMAQGIVGALLAGTLNIVIIELAQYHFPNIFPETGLEDYLLLMGILILISLIIIIPSTFITCKKYLKTDINQLY
jgi:cell division transport system permease protein